MPPQNQNIGPEVAPGQVSPEVDLKIPKVKGVRRLTPEEIEKISQEHGLKRETETTPPEVPQEGPVKVTASVTTAETVVPAATDTPSVVQESIGTVDPVESLKASEALLENPKQFADNIINLRKKYQEQSGAGEYLGEKKAA